MAASASLLAERRAAGLCPRDGRQAAPFVYCEDCRHARAQQSAKSAARRAGKVVPPAGRPPLTASDLDELATHAAAGGEAILYAPPLRGQGHGVELVRRGAATR